MILAATQMKRLPLRQSRRRIDLRGELNIGALIITYTILGVAYYDSCTLYAPKPYSTYFGPNVCLDPGSLHWRNIPGCCYGYW